MPLPREFLTSNLLLIMNTHSTSVYLIAKNEEANILRSLNSLRDSGLKIYLIDSGSVDRTISIAESYKDVEVISRPYISHCETYNFVLSSAMSKYVIILDADTTFRLRDLDKFLAIMEKKGLDAIVSPVNFFVESVHLRYGSLYPPKPFLFRVGKKLFERIGHAEKLIDGVKYEKIGFNAISHDDRKSFNRFIDSQILYHKKIEEAILAGKYTWRDWLRIKTPFFGLISFVYILIFKLGLLSGKVGMIYALDRLIAESIIHRQSLAEKLKKETN